MIDFAIETEARCLNKLLYGRNLSLATAESCTSGEIAAAITEIPGSSAYFKGGLVAYATEMKEQYLHVSPETVAAHTVVSEEVVKEMVKGACKMFVATYAVATSGVAGPTGGTPEIPVGTIWIAAGNEQKIVTQCLSDDNGRTLNVKNAVLAALRLLTNTIKDTL